MPGQVARFDGRFHASSVRRSGVLQIVIDEPGACRPDKPFGFPFPTQDFSGFEDLWNKHIDVLRSHCPGEVRESEVEMRLENEMNGLDGSGHRQGRAAYLVTDAGYRISSLPTIRLLQPRRGDLFVANRPFLGKLRRSDLFRDHTTGPS